MVIDLLFFKSIFSLLYIQEIQIFVHTVKYETSHDYAMKLLLINEYHSSLNKSEYFMNFS